MQRGRRVLIMVPVVILCQGGRRQPVAVGGVNGHYGICHALAPYPLGLLGVILDHSRADQTLAQFRCDSLDRFFQTLPPEISGMVHLNHIGLDYSMLCHPHGSGQRLFCVMHPWGLSLALPISHRDDKGICGLDHELIHPTGHPAQCVGAERALGCQAVLGFDCLPGVKDRRTRKRPVNDLRSTPPGQLFPVLDLLTVSGGVGGFWPDNGPPIAPGNQEEPLAGGGCAIVGGYQLPPLHIITKGIQLPDELLEGLALLTLHRLATADRPPGLKLLHILQDDDPGADCTRPAQGDPGKAPD